jgi:hypothetical protein
MSFLKEHPVAAVLIGIGIGLAFGSQLRRIPGVSKIPAVG